MKYKVGDKVRVKRTLSAASSYGGVLANTDMAKRSGEIVTITKIYDNGYNISGDYWFWSDEMLEPVDNIVRMADGTIIGDFSTGGFCGGFRGGKEPADVDGGLVSIHDIDTHELWTTPFIIPKDRLDVLVDAWAKLGCTTFNLVPDEVKEVIKKTEEKKMPTKFTFYTVDTSRINKTNNTKVDTIMTCVHIGDKVGYATCDKEDYDEREGILNAIANLCCDGSFDKAYRKAVKEKKISETLDRTCSYCRKVFDTIAEREAHEAWHVENKKARRQRYLERKEARDRLAEMERESRIEQYMKELAK